jgi:hypothetical protein
VITINIRAVMPSHLKKVFMIGVFLIIFLLNSRVYSLPLKLP